MGNDQGQTFQYNNNKDQNKVVSDKLFFDDKGDAHRIPIYAGAENKNQNMGSRRYKLQFDENGNYERVPMQ